MTHSSGDDGQLRTDACGERGQAMIEALMLSWIVILLVGAGFQLYLVNRTIFRTLTAGHYVMMREAFAHNCWQDNPRCRYNRNNGLAILGPTRGVPEATLPRLRIFGGRNLPPRLWSANPEYPRGYRDGRCQDRPDLPCLRIKAAAGTYQGYWEALRDVF